MAAAIDVADVAVSHVDDRSTAAAAPRVSAPVCRTRPPHRRVDRSPRPAAGRQGPEVGHRPRRRATQSRAGPDQSSGPLLRCVDARAPRRPRAAALRGRVNRFEQVGVEQTAGRTPPRASGCSARAAAWRRGRVGSPSRRGLRHRLAEAALGPGAPRITSEASDLDTRPRRASMRVTRCASGSANSRSNCSPPTQIVRSLS
jgi:hypothetical protein